MAARYMFEAGSTTGQSQEAAVRAAETGSGVLVSLEPKMKYTVSAQPIVHKKHLMNQSWRRTANMSRSGCSGEG
jgi:hypothetical protein